MHNVRRSGASTHITLCVAFTLLSSSYLGACAGASTGASLDGGTSDGGSFDANENLDSEAPDGGAPDGETRDPDSGSEDPTAVAPWELTASQDIVAHVHLTWRAPTTSAAITQYIIRRDGKEVARVPATETTFDDDGASESDLGKPTSVAASDETQPAVVEITWGPPLGGKGTSHQYTVAAAYGDRLSPWSSPSSGHRVAPRLTGYVVRRDGSDIATVAPDAVRFYSDTGATQGTVTTPALSVTQTRTDGVLLTWTTPDTKSGAVHTYDVVATYENDERRASDTDTGARGKPILNHCVIKRDQADFANMSAGTVSFLDAIQPSGGLFVTSSATWDPVAGRVRLEPTEPPEFFANPSTVHFYQVTLVYRGGPSVSTTAEQGHPGAGAVFTYQWQRSAADADASYVDLPGATEALWFDTTLPVAEGRYYRLKVDGEAGFTGRSFGERVAR